MALRRSQAPLAPGIFSWSNSIENAVTASLATAYLIFALYQIWKFSYNWPQVDDFTLVQWYKHFDITNSSSIISTLSTHLSIHPVGAQALFQIFIFGIFGLNIKALIIVNTTIVALTALIAGRIAQITLQHAWVRTLAPLAALAAFFHPIQTNHLIWAFETGWFLVNFIVVLNIFLLERMGPRSFPYVCILLMIGSFCSAQGMVGWLCVLLHTILLRWHKYHKIACIALLIGFLTNIFSISRLLETNASTASDHSIAGYTSYFLSVIGSILCTTHRDFLIASGLMVITSCIIVFIIGLRCNFNDSAHRILLVCITASLACVILFEAGRYDNGIDWAVDLFHFAPLLAPLIFAFGLMSLLLLDQRNAGALALGIVLFGCTVGSIVSAIPFMQQRGAERRTKAAFAMHVMCNNGYSPYVVASANLSLQWYKMIGDLKSTLMPLCSSDEPASARALEVMPDKFVDIIRMNPATRDALSQLWDVYTVHFDLQRAFPPNRPDLLLDFAYNNARTGSGYETSMLKPFASVFLDLGKR